MNGVYLGIGGNAGERAENLRLARKAITEKIGAIIKSSSVYKTAPWGNTKQADFYNQVLFVKTNLPVEKVLKESLAIEDELGRKRTKKWGPRTMDIDILFYNNDIIKKKNLNIPHPRLTERNFVLVPMNEIAPHFIHPVCRKKIFTLLRNSPDKLPTIKIKAHIAE